LPQQRATVYSRIDKRVEQDVGDRNKAINRFSSTDRWTNREGKSRAGTVLKNKYISIIGKIISQNG